MGNASRVDPAAAAQEYGRLLANGEQVHAAYVMGTNATAIRDYEELRRIKEERYLLTMLQVDKSHVPLPDEPPVEDGQRDLQSAVMVLDGGRWKVSDLQGQVDFECEFAPTDRGLPSV